MTLIFEVDRPVQWKPGVYRSRAMVRAWWLWFAVSKLRISLHEFTTTAFDWRDK